MLHHKLWFPVTRLRKQQICGSTSGAVHRARPRAASRAAGKWTWRILPQYPLSRPVVIRRGVRAHLYGLYEQPASAKPGITDVMPQRVVREGSAGGPQSLLRTSGALRTEAACPAGAPPRWLSTTKHKRLDRPPIADKEAERIRAALAGGMTCASRGPSSATFVSGSLLGT